MNNGGKIVIAALAGAAVGAAVGLLLAPEKGSKLRKRLSKKGGNVKDSLMEKIDEGLSSLKSVKQKLAGSMDRAAEAVTD